MGKIATEFEVKQKVNGYRTINEDKCCTKDRAVAIGANPRYVEEINHGYENEMSMYLSYLSRNVSGTISYSGLNAYDGVSNKILISSVDAMKSN